MDAQEQIERSQEFLIKTYEQELHKLNNRGEFTLLTNFQKLASFDHELADILLEEPEEIIRAFELAIDNIIENKKFKSRFFNLPKTQSIAIRNIRSNHINKFMFFEAIVRQSSDVRPQVTSAKFECPSCGNTISILQLDQKFKEPSRCTCGRRGKFRLLSKELVDAQRLVVEESPEELEGGEQPKRLSVFLQEDLVEPKMEKRTTPGSKIQVTGVIKEIPILLRTGAPSTRYDLMMEANSIIPVEETFEDLEISEEDETKIKELSKDPNVYLRLTNSIAPSIYGHDKVKEAVVLQLMGGVQKKRDDGTKTRGDMHILLVGDPGAGKSQILNFVSKIAPKARYISGKGASAAGLTASVVKDEFLKGWALEAGAMVLANGGFCCIDELDKMSQEDTSALHEALEQQRISISKANIQACYSEDTEVLTEQGWKKYDEVKNLKIAQYDLKNKKVNFSQHKGLYVYDFKEEMFHFKNKRIDMLVTPNHKMLLKREKSKFFECILAENISSHKFQVINSGNYQGKESRTFILPAIKHKQNRKHLKYTQQEKPKTIPLDLWLEFLGYYVTEGGLQRRASFGIPQKRGIKAEKINKCLLHLGKYIGFKLTESKEGEKYIRFQITNTQLVDYLEKDCGKNHLKKRLPLKFNTLSKRQLKIVFNAMMVGDGASDNKSFTSTSKELIDQFHAIAMLIGMSASLHVQYDQGYRGKRVRTYRVCLSNKTSPEMKRKQIKKIPYDGKVFCFSTETGFFVTRRNGKIAIQGNTLRTETTVLAAANPKLGRFDPYASIASQIDLPAALINRFDLIFPIRDIPNREIDTRIASHVLKLQQKPTELQPEIPTDLMRKYISYARKRIKPVLTDQAIEEIKKFYVELRNKGQVGDEGIKPIPISARQLEALVRLAEGSARVRLSKKVTALDSKRSIDLLRHCLMQVGFDYETGEIDIDRITTGISSSQRSKIVTVREIIRELEHKHGKNIPISEIIALAQDRKIEEAQVEESIEKLKREGEIFEPRPGQIARL